MSKSKICSACGSKAIYGININDEVLCDKCIFQAANALKKQNKKEPIKEEFLVEEEKILSPIDLVKELDKHIIGQDKAKEILSIAIYNHKKRTEHNLKCEEEGDYDNIIEKSNIILLGPTGVGKTATIKQLARLTNVPFVVADATGLTSAGYAGKDVDTILETLIQSADGDIEWAEQGIVFIDEFDKLSRKGGEIRAIRDIGGEGVQQALLKMIEGTDYLIQKQGGNILSQSENKTINTENILFIMGGAFEGLEKQVEEESDSNVSRIGFSLLEDDKDESIKKNVKEIETEDLRKYGILPEILGRAPVICEFNELTLEELERVLIEPKNSIIDQMKRLVALSDAKLEVTDDAITKIAEIAVEKKTGARSLRGVIENIMKNVFIKLPSKEIDKIIIDRESIDTEVPKIVKHVNIKTEEG